ncbi:hypothetical protein HII13_004701 [Brettanomyces bruxellensis]|nr:hypothetical protein HII13_004701 [Brettanomyces bruxellensis]
MESGCEEIALSNLVQFSKAGPDSEYDIFRYKNYQPIKDLKILARDRKASTVRDAETILSNLCDDDSFRELIAKDDDFLTLVLKQITDTNNANGDLACILLSNMAKSDSMSRIFSMNLENNGMNDMFKSSKIPNCLIDIFTFGTNHKINRFANYDYLAYFFADTSRFETGRTYYTSRQDYDSEIPLKKLLKFTTDESKARREEKQMDSQQRIEPDIEIRITFLESVLLLCVTRQGRDHLRSNGVYPIVRELDKESKNDKVTDIVYRIVDMLMREEKPKDQYDSKSEKEQINAFLQLEDKEKFASKLTIQNGDKAQSREEEDESDSDDQIIEVV